MFDIDPRLCEFLLERNDEEMNGPLMPTHVIVVAEYLDEDGDACWSSHCEGNGQVSGAIGLLEFAKDRLLEDMREWS